MLAQLLGRLVSDVGLGFGAGLSASGLMISVIAMVWGPLDPWGPIGAFAGILGLVVALFFGATRWQAKGIAAGVGEVSAKQDMANQKLDVANQKLDGANQKIDQTNHQLHDIVGILRDIRDDFRRGRP